MSVPSELGWYWWREGEGEGWTVVEVSGPGGDLFAVGDSFHFRVAEDFGEWGPRVPSPGRLAALAELASGIERVMRALETGEPVLSNQGQGLDGFAALAEFRGVGERWLRAQKPEDRAERLPLSELTLNSDSTDAVDGE